MPQKKYEGRTFEDAEKFLKSKQAIKPQKRNYYLSDWYNKHYGSKLDAMRAFSRAMRGYKDKIKSRNKK